MYFKIVKLKNVTSTNNYAYKLAQGGQREITCVVAKSQSKGKGRMGRKWVSKSGKGIYVSFIFRPDVGLEKVNLLSIAIALAAVKALNHIIPLKIKWPNDVIVGNKKIGGVLLEACSGAKYPLFVIAGLGLNVNSGIKDMPRGATSLFLETKRKYEIDKIFKRIVKEVIILYKDFKRGYYKVIVEEAADYIDTLARKVSVDTGRKKIKGVAYRIGKYGALYIKDDRGRRKKILASEIVHCR
ncbi:MAG: biotin--[acetyl-CoA-carboxylase] ligase [Thermoplasmata archaeon]|nr:MAG: biotin--[acetyl-CoA-carboxylase] ligase [Thermoplasmata archaeon]